jgi:DNA-binding transcriptional LysR family regulator
MTVSLNTLDLNLLRVFAALMDERSVLRAGLRVGLSQSAVSHALARLREALRDELFVRTTAGMQPTARALAMATPVREALVRIELAVSSAGFDPASSRRQFTLAADDYTTAVIVPEILGLLNTEAPNVDLVIRPRTRIDLAEQIDLGRIDVAIGSFAAIPERLRSNVLFHDEDALATDRQRPRKAAIGVSDLANVPLLVVTLGGQEEGALDGFISERGLYRRSEMFDRPALVRALAALKLAPRIALAVPHFLALPHLLAVSDAVAIVPRLLATFLASSGSVVVHRTPYHTERVAVRAVWHERNDDDAAHKWLRGIVQRAVTLATSSGGQAGAHGAERNDTAVSSDTDISAYLMERARERFDKCSNDPKSAAISAKVSPQPSR